MTGVTVVLDRAAIRALAHEGWVGDRLFEIGDGIAAEARRDAPKKTGRGAASIHTELVAEESGYAAHVSWDRPHFYMRFTDAGTIYIAAQHYLELALRTQAEVSGGGFSTVKTGAAPRKRRAKGSLTNAKGEFNAKYYGGTKRRRKTPKAPK